MKKAILGLGSGIVAGILVVLVVLNVATPVVQNHTTIGVKLVVEVHRTNGETERYVKEGDLILKNFANIIIALVSPTSDTEDDKKYVDESGALRGLDNTGGNGYICIGTGTTPASLNDYKLENQVVCFAVQDGDISINGSDIIVDIFASWTTDTAYNITEVGLKTKGLYNDAYPAFIMRDVLTEPIQLSAGDGITVHYYIFLDNP